MTDTTADFIRELTALAASARGITIATASPPADVVGLPTLIPYGVRHGTAPEVINLRPLFEHWRNAPERKRGTAQVKTLDGFVALTRRHQTAHSVIFADTDWTAPSLTTVIDYHECDTLAAGFCAHRIVYKFPLSDPWKAWMTQNGQPMQQGEFAAFIEDHIHDLAAASPDHAAEIQATFGARVATPAELMQLSRGLLITVDSSIKSAVNLQSGEAAIAFEETHRDADGRPLRIPGMFLLKIAPFFMGEPATIPVRLRYRVKDGKAVWFFQIYRPDIHVTERVRADLLRAQHETGLATFEGTAES